MSWFKRQPRASSSSLRPRLGVETLEDRTVPTAGSVISGNVFFDVNRNSANDAGDVSMPGITVDLTGTTALGNAVNLTITTNSGGSFQFLKLEPGSYNVSANNARFTSPTGILGNTGGIALGNQVQTISLGQGQIEANVRFALTNIVPDTSKLSLRLLLNTNVGQTSQIFSTEFGNAGEGKSYADGIVTGDDQDLSGTGSLSGTVTDDTGAAVANAQVILSNVTRTGVPILSSGRTDASGNYFFGKLTSGTYFINVVPFAGQRASVATVGSLGGSAPRADQLAPTFLSDGANGAGYNFTLAGFTSDLDAGLANDVAGGSLDGVGVTSDATIRGRVQSAVASLEARFTTGPSTAFVSVKGSLAADGSFVLNQETLRSIFGGGMADGDYTVQIQAVTTSGVLLTKDVSFTLKSQGPAFLNAFVNLTKTASTANETILLAGAFTDPNVGNSTVTMKVLKGTTPVDLKLELFDKDAPRTVANFFNYFDRYDDNGGVLFHRLFLEQGLKVLQGGGYTFNEATDAINSHLTQDPTIRNEYSADRPNERGTIAMAKLPDPDSASSEFFFNLDDVNATSLNVNNPAPNGGSGGFTVFGKVLSDADLAVLDDLAATPIVNTAIPGSSTSPLPVVGGGAVNENTVVRIQQIVTVQRDNHLTYSATSSNPAVVAVTTGGFQGNALTLDYAAAGTATITVTCTDATGNSMTTTFLVTVT